jgi:hypothetical protein
MAAIVQAAYQQRWRERFGIQIAAVISNKAHAAGLAWLDHVAADLEDAGYAVGAADLCAAGVGAPHARLLLRTLLQKCVELVDGMEIVSAEERTETEHSYERKLGYESLVLKFRPRA